MTAVGERVAAEALTWVGTPYRHQASCRGGGTDCLGLLRGIWREIYGREPEAIPPYSADWSEPQAREELLSAAERHLKKKSISDVARGDVLLFRMRSRSVAKHLGIQINDGEASDFVHAYSGHGVELSPLSDPWQRRIAARFAFPS